MTEKQQNTGKLRLALYLDASILDSAQASGSSQDSHQIVTRWAQEAEQAGFAYVALADSAEAAEPAKSGGPAAEHYAALELQAYVSVATTTIGLAVELSTAYNKPFHAARGFASLDYISQGRSAWIIKARAGQAEHYNVTGQALPETATLLEQSNSFSEIAFKLWDSWEDGAIISDKENGRYVDGDKVHYIHHTDRFYSVRGPLNVPRPPQGYPVIVRDVNDVLRREDGTLPYTDILLVHPTATGNESWTASWRQGATAADTSAVRQGSSADAAAVGDATVQHDEYVQPLLFAAIAVSIQPAGEGESALSFSIETGSDTGISVLTGTAAEVTQQIIAWHEHEGIDGIQLRPTSYKQWLLFVQEIIPLLQERGLLAEAGHETAARELAADSAAGHSNEGHGRLLRESLGLPRPVNVFESVAQRA